MDDAIRALWRLARFCWHRGITLDHALVRRDGVTLHEVSVEAERASAMYEGARIEVDIRVRPLPGVD